MTKNTATVTVTDKIEGVFVGVLFLSDGNFYDVSGDTVDELVKDATEIANSIGVVIEVYNT